MEVKTILLSTIPGTEVVEHLKGEHWPDKPFMKTMLSILLNYLISSSGGTSESYYPTSIDKVKVAKGIIRDFPLLSDDGKGKGHLAWYDPTTCKGFLAKKLEYLRVKHLKPGEKRTRINDRSEGSSNSSATLDSSDSCGEENSPSEKGQIS